MRRDFKCNVDQNSNTVILSELFHSYGYDPDLDKVLKIDLVDVISRNPSSVTPDLSFTVTAFDLYNGEYSPVNARTITVPDFVNGGQL